MKETAEPTAAPAPACDRAGVGAAGHAAGDHHRRARSGDAADRGQPERGQLPRPRTGPPRRPLRPPRSPGAETLTDRIANCVGVWETNRGGDAPNLTESSFDTVAGVKASMATVEQATKPYALDALRRNASLRKLARRAPPSRRSTTRSPARRRSNPADGVKTAADAGTTADDFIKAQQATIIPTGSSTTTPPPCSAPSTLKNTIDTKHGETGGKKQEDPKQAAGEIPRPTASAWAPVADLLHPRPEEVGRESRRLAAPRGRPDARRRRHPHQRRRDVLRRHRARRPRHPRPRGRRTGHKGPEPHRGSAGQRRAAKNNPNETGYGDNIWATYQRLYVPGP